MRKPTFLIVGAMKAGTTSLQRYLRHHAPVYMSRPKELHYFDRQPGNAGGTKWTGPIPDDAAYEAIFESNTLPRHETWGEATPTYCYVPVAARRIKEYNPDALLVMIMRDPVRRAISHVRQRAWKKDADLDTWSELVVDLEEEAAATEEEWFPRIRGYHARGRYHEQIARLKQHFPEDQLLLMRLEDLVARPEQEIARLTDFIGVRRLDRSEFKAFNTREYEQPEEKIVEHLRDYYREHNQLLHEKHGISIEGWI